MKTSIGLPVWYNTIRKDYSIDVLLNNILDHLLDNGLSLFEISIDYPWIHIDYNILEDFIGEAINKGFSISLHAPWRDLFLASPYDKIREESINIIINNMGPIISRYPVEYIVLHVTSMQKQSLGNTRNDLISSAISSIETIAKWAGEYGITVCIENMPRGFTSRIEDLSEIITDNVFVALDIAHLYNVYIHSYYNNYSDFPALLRDSISMLGNKNIRVIHYHDVMIISSRNFKHVVEHLIPGAGILEHKKLLKILKDVKPRYLMVEAFINSDGKHLKIHQVMEKIREFITWVKVYLW